MMKIGALILGLCLLTSCATWDSPENVDLFRATKMTPDSVVLEIFSSVATGSDGSTDPSWLEHDVDEQQISLDTRGELAANSMMCGVLGSHLPETVLELLGSSDGKQGGDLDSDQDSDPMLPDALIVAPIFRRVQTPPGERCEIMLPTPKGSFTLLLNKGGTASGNTYQNAQGLLALKSFPLGDGRVRLEITPEIHFGPIRRVPRGKNGVWEMSPERDRDTFEHLKMEATLSPGQWLVVTATDDAIGFGQRFFTESVDDQVVRRLTFIRLAQTQHDDRLSPLH